MKLTVASDLEPLWSLVSRRAEVQGQSRNLSWGDRVRLAPSLIGAVAHYHLGWQRGSVLNRISEERADASAALVEAAREARATFGGGAQAELGETLGIVAATAEELGIPIGQDFKRCWTRTRFLSAAARSPCTMKMAFRCAGLVSVRLGLSLQVCNEKRRRRQR